MKDISKKEIMEKDVLNRILWDKKLNPADFDIHYFDRVKDRLEKVRFTDIELEDDFFRISEGLVQVHRIRRIACKGEIVWSRDRSVL